MSLSNSITCLYLSRKLKPQERQDEAHELALDEKDQEIERLQIEVERLRSIVGDLQGKAEELLV